MSTAATFSGFNFVVGQFSKPFDWKRIRENAQKFFVFHSEDDALVSVENGKELAHHLDAELHLEKRAGHFNAKAGYTEFPELLALVVREASKKNVQ